MTTMLVWLLLVNSAGAYNYGTVSVLERFEKKEQCEHVLKSIPNKDTTYSRCVQAEILIKK